MTTEIRSYRRVFDLERRIYRVDSVRLNPGGVPVRGIVYFLAALLCALVAGKLPLLGTAARAVPWYLRDVAVPGAAAVLFAAIRIEGRPFHLAAAAALRYHGAPRRLAGARRSTALPSRWRPDDIVILPDGSDAQVRSLRYTGPGALRVAAQDSAHISATLRWGPRWALRRGARVALGAARAGDDGGARIVLLERGARLTLRSRARS